MGRDYEGVSAVTAMDDLAEKRLVGDRMAGQNKANVNQCATARLSGQEAIERRMEVLSRELNGLRALLRSLPRELSREADEALWELVTNR